MKIYILTDLEGAAGVNRWTQTREGETPEKWAAMKLLTHEINAAIDGIHDAAPGAEMVVWDGHGSGGIDYAEIHKDALVIMHGRGNKPPYCLDDAFDAQFFVGQHAMAGTPDAPLCHTYSSRTIEYYKINGILMGEFGCRAAMAGAFGVPTVFISGDDKACAEAKSLIPNVFAVETKKGLGIELALHLSPHRAQRNIRIAIANAVRHIRDVPPFKIDPPYEQEIRVLDGCNIEGYLNRGAEKIDDRTVVKRSENICELFI